MRLVECGCAYLVAVALVCRWDHSSFQVSVESLVKVIGMMDKHILDTADLQMNVLPVSSHCTIQYLYVCVYSVNE